MANAANHVNLSTGHVLFSDPTLPWGPSNFPALPPTSLALTASGTIAGRNIEKLSFSNAIQYEPFEGPSTRGGLTKSLVVNSQGNVTYADPKVSLVSTVLSAYNIGVTAFGSSNIGAPGISSSPPDTLTNAIAKLDAWITTGMLSQPPAVSIAQVEDSSLYAGVRWYNFPVYNVFNGTVPFVSGIVLLLGDPATNNYLTLELTNSAWFPDRQFTDGLASDFYPLVRLRIFDQFFPTSGNQVYSKAYMATQCVKIIGESGTYTLPSSGKVFSIENSVLGETYTTLNLYLPQIPPGTNIPVRIVYINKTQATVNIAQTSTTLLTYGGPSQVTSIVQHMSTPSSFSLLVTPPLYSDAANLVSTPYLSSYNVAYTVSQYNTAHAGDLGFRYGLTTPTPVIYPSYLNNYIGSTLSKASPVQCGTQEITIMGSDNSAVLPGLQWSTSVYATNLAYKIGSTLAGPNPVVSGFPNVTTPSISTANIVLTSPWTVNAYEQKLKYLYYNNGWNLDGYLSTNVVFVSSSTQLTTYAINGAVRFNDASYPGCRSNVDTSVVFKDLDGVPQTIGNTYTSVSNDFSLGVTQGGVQDINYFSTILSDSQIAPSYQKFYYNISATGGQYISSISSQAQSLTINLQTPIISGFNDPIVIQVLSTPTCFISTEPANSSVTQNILFASTVTNLTQISGMYTPEIGSEFMFDIVASNFAYNYACALGLGAGQILYNGSNIGPVTNYMSSVYIYKDATEVTQLPIYQNSTLCLSSCTAIITSNVYQDPADPGDFAIRAKANYGNPTAPANFLTVDLGNFLYIDTISEELYSTFTDMNSSNGQRVLSLLPRYEIPGTVDNMNDGVNIGGNYSNGLNTATSSFFILGYTDPLFVSSSVVYNNTSSISSFYTDPYSRELLYTNGTFVHPGGLDFDIFDGAPLGKPDAIYPNFMTDLVGDVNYGNRYASFLFNSISNAEPTAYQYMNIGIHNVSALGPITSGRTSNFYFPNDETMNSYLRYCKVRIHAKFFAEINNGVPQVYESAWINCLKTVDYDYFDDSVYDIGGLVSITTSASDVFYKVQIKRRFYTNVYPLVRIGISRDGSAEGLPPGSSDLPISFEFVTMSVTDF